MPQAIMALGAIVLGFALQISDGFYDERALIWLGVAALCCAIATLGLVPAGVRALDEPRVVTGLLVAGVLSSVVALALTRPGMYLTEQLPRQHPLFLAGLAIVGLGVLAGVAGVPLLRRAWFPAILVTFVVLGVWLIHASPTPHIDVITVYDYAGRALAHGRDPYTMTYPNIYGTDAFYPPGAVMGGRVVGGFPYPPLSLLLGLPGQMLLGDVRYSQLAALAGSGALVGFARRGPIAPLAATLLLFTPRVFFVLEQAWTEPLTLLALTATLYTALYARRSMPIALGLLIAMKQYMIIALPLAWLLTSSADRQREWWRLVGIALLTATLVTLPFVLWNVPGFVQSVITWQLRERFRLDSLSVLSWLAYAGVSVTPTLVLAASGAALVVGVSASLWRASRTPAGFAAAVALTLLLVFACSKKAFCNYYFFTLGVMCAAVATASDPEG
jgi:hypothetical protein